jgi:bile acid:Na+ symporter, BASS family
MNTPAVLLVALMASIALTVFALGLHATVTDATSLVRQPGKLTRSLLVMTVLMPLIAVALVSALDLRPAVKIALATLSLAPVPPFWPRKSLKAGGAASVTMGLLVVTTIVSIVSIPLSVEVFEHVFGMHLRESTSTIARIVSLTILLPLAGGMAVRHVAPSLARRVATGVALLGTVLLIAPLIPLVIRMWADFTQFLGDGTFVAMVAFVTAGLMLGHALGGPVRGDRPVLALAAMSRHPGIAIAIAHGNFPSERLVPAAILLYVLISGVATLPYLKRVQRRRTRVTSYQPQGHRSDRPAA